MSKIRKTYIEADCYSDHNSLVSTINFKLKKIKNNIRALEELDFKQAYNYIEIQESQYSWKS